jgi:hypothetical protein
MTKICYSYFKTSDWNLEKALEAVSQYYEIEYREDRKHRRCKRKTGIRRKSTDYIHSFIGGTGK